MGGMGSRVQAIGILLVGIVTALAGWSASPAPTNAAVMCPPLTMDDLLEEETTTTTSAPPATSTPTTTAPATTTTAPPATTTTTTMPPTTAPETSVPDTTVPSETTTTDTTLPETTVPETTVPETTVPTTTVPPTTTTTLPPCDEDFVYPMVFPILGSGGIGSPFGAPRDGGRRLHAGNDIFAPHLQPIVAVADGTVSRIGGDEGISGNRIYIRHDDGWSTLYIHLNNDTAGTDDGNGRGVRSDLEVGTEVTAGQVIGWVGDSGNAEGTVHHLHFELRDPNGNPVDPEASLGAAARSTVAAAPEGAIEFDGPFADRSWEDEDTIDPMTLLLSRGAAVWCDEIGAMACPDGAATAEAIAVWLRPLIGEVSLSPAPPAPSEPTPRDVELPVTRAELMRAFAWDRLRDAYQNRGFRLDDGIPDAAWATPAPPPPDHPYDLSLDAATQMLGPGASCPGSTDIRQPLTRAEAAQWIIEYLGWSSNDQCGVIVSTTSFTR